MLPTRDLQLEAQAAASAASAAEASTARAREEYLAAQKLLHELESDASVHKLRAEAAERRIADLHAYVATARRTLPALHTELLPPIDCDDIVYFKLDAAGQRVHALLDLCAAEFAESGRSGCGWEGIIDHAKGRLMRAQCTGMGDAAYLHVLSLRQRQLLGILRSACLSTANYLDNTLPPAPSSPVPLEMRALRQMFSEAIFSTSLPAHPAAAVHSYETNALESPPHLCPAPSMSNLSTTDAATSVTSISPRDSSPPASNSGSPLVPDPLPEAADCAVQFLQPIACHREDSHSASNDADQSREALPRQQFLDIGQRIADAVRARRIAFQQLFVLADASQQGLVTPDCMAHAFAGLGIQNVAQEPLHQFCVQIAGDDGLIGIHDMRAAIPIESLGDGSGDWESRQRQLLMTRLRHDGQNLKGFWEQALRSCGGEVSAGQLQECIDQVTGQQSCDGNAVKGVVSSYFCDNDCVLTFDDVYDSLVCL